MLEGYHPPSARPGRAPRLPRVLTRLRGLWRSARSLPILRAPLVAVDRLWWARVIRRSGVVDAVYAGLQLGRPVSERHAIRAYVRGGFASGLSLNPLFSERLVSGQLPDSDRVPALYAYLLTDPARIETSCAWDAPADAGSGRAPGPAGPLGDAWRALSSGRSLVLRGGATVTLSDLHAAAARVLRPDSPDSPARVPAGVVLRWELGPEDADGAGLRAPMQVLDEDRRSPESDARGTTLLLEIETAPAEVRLQAAQLALGDPRVLLIDRAATHLADPPPGSVLVRRAPGALVTADTLRALIAASASGPVAPVWLSPDGTVASAGVLVHDGAPYRVLAGHPAEDARSLGSALPVAAIDAPVTARTIGAGAEERTLLDESVLGGRPGDVPAPMPRADGVPPEPRGLRAAGWARGAAGLAPRYVRSAETFRLGDGTEVPRLRWAIKTGAPAGPRGESWGETHFARALAGALERHGQYASVDARPARARPSSGLDDVVLALRGPHRLPAPPSAHSLLWIISHPDEIGADEVAGYDLVYAASTPWAHAASERFGSEVRALLQCTDARRFQPSGLARGTDLVFVGTARGIARPSVVEPLRAGRPVRVYGPDWRGYIPGSAIAGTHVPNDALPALYESAGAVLNDHWPAMRREGFVSNRLFDVVAAGGRAISDDVSGIVELFGGAVRTYREVPELLALTEAPLDPKFCDDDELSRISHRIRAQHSFDARAGALLADVLARA